jgi:hypothetical protein
MNSLERANILCDDGIIEKNFVLNLANSLNIVFPNLYVIFIVNHNGASLSEIDCFDFYDNNRDCENRESIAFLNVMQINGDMKSLLKQSTDNPNDSDIFKLYKYFDSRLIPFGETGGGDFICFDYRNDQKTDNPPITYWCHDAQEPNGRTSFIANSFEEFINMLHEPEDK